MCLISEWGWNSSWENVDVPFQRRTERIRIPARSRTSQSQVQNKKKISPYHTNKWHLQHGNKNKRKWEVLKLIQRMELNEKNVHSCSPAPQEHQSFPFCTQGQSINLESLQLLQPLAELCASTWNMRLIGNNSAYKVIVLSLAFSPMKPCHDFLSGFGIFMKT